MISRDKVRLMNQVALLNCQAKHHENRICQYRRRDYLFLHLFVSWFTASAVWLVLFSVFLVFFLSDERAVTYSASDLPGTLLTVTVSYMVFCVVWMLIANHFYKRRYERARKWSYRYQAAVDELAAFYQTERARKPGEAEKT